MDRPADIIPISSRRPNLTPVRAPEGVSPDSTFRRRTARGNGVPPIVFVGAVMLIAGLSIGQWRSDTSLKRVPDAIRVGEYRRALADAEETCTRPEAAEGPLRQHCVDEARFLILFEECDAHCRSVTEAILPRARHSGR